MSFFLQTFSMYQSYPRDRQWWSLSCHMTGTSTPSTTHCWCLSFYRHCQCIRATQGTISGGVCHVMQISASDTLSPQIPRTRLSTVGSCAFSVFGPFTWNDLPLPLWQKPSLDSFRSNLKTFPKTVDLPCFVFHADVFIHSRSPRHLLPFWAVYILALYGQNAWQLCVQVPLSMYTCVRVCMHLEIE